MKTFNISFIAAVISVSLLSLTGCQKEENVLSGKSSDTLSARVVNPSTKTVYIDNGTAIDVQWALEDQLVLFKNDSKTGADQVVFELQSAYAGSSEGVFSIANDAQKPVSGQSPTDNQYNWESEYIAYYPSTAQKRELTAEEFLGQFPQQLQLRNNNMEHLEKYDLMKATKAAGDDELAFAHQVAVLKLIVQVPTSTGDAYSESTDYSSYWVDNVTVRGLWGSRAYQVSIGGDSQAINYTYGDKTYKVVIAYVTVPAVNVSAGQKLDVDMMMHYGQSAPTFKNSHVYADAVSYQAGKMYVCEIGMTDPYSVTEYIDLGLPSGTLWAKSNLGATESNPEGHYFQWGEVNGFKYRSNTRMVFDPATQTYSEVTETIGNSSCFLNDADYASLYEKAGFRASTFSINNEVNAWYDSEISYTAPDYQGIIAQWPYQVTSYEYTSGIGNDATWGFVNGQYVRIFEFRGTWYSGIGQPYSGTRYTRTEKTETAYHTVGDAATYQLGEAWHMPAAWQIAELLEYTTHKEENGKLIFTSTVEGYTNVSMDISNSSGWENGWTNVKTGECRFQTTTAAKYGDNKNFERTGEDDNYCWEFHYNKDNGDPYMIGLHSHHSRSTAVPIRPVAVIQANRN